MECGIERLTLGSDAHRPEDTGRGFEQVRDILEKAGIN
jgi:histidinol phosphatase-like PHP family hydrolase